MADIKEVIDMMVADGRPDAEIRALIDRYNKEKAGKAQDSTVDPTMSQDDMGSGLDDGSSESVSWFDQTWFGRGVAAASTTGEATDLMAQDFSNVSMESIQEFMKAKEQESKSHVPSERMNKFQKKYKEEGSTWSAFFRGVKDQPGLLPELFVQSLGTQVGTLIDSPGASLAAAGTGAAGGAALGAAGFGVGAIAGGVAGAMGGLATSMEAALTFGELIETELKEEGKEFTDENIKALLEGPKGNSIRNKSIGRGLTIGAIEGLSGGIAGKAAVATKGAVAATRGAKTATLAASTAGVGVEAVGGATGEVLGRAVAGQEMDAAEIGFEAITGTVTAPLNVSAALLTAKKPTYKLNGSSVTYEQMKDFVDTADPMDIARANIQMKDDYTGIGNKAKAKQEAVREGIKLSGDEATIAEVDKAKRDNQISDTIEFAETQGKKIGKDVKVVEGDVAAQEFYDKLVKQGLAEEKNVKGADGFIIGDSIIINKDIAGQTGQINVGAHEVLHGILAKHLKSLVKVDKKGKVTDDSKLRDFISDFKTTISKESRDYIENIINRRNEDVVNEDGSITSGEGLDINTTDEWLTIYSDGITKEQINFNEGAFTKFKNFVQNIFRKFGYNKEFKSGLDTYNFMRDYQKSIKEGALSQRAIGVAGDGTTVTEGKLSKSPLESINDLIPKNIKTKKEFNAFVQDRRLFPPVFMATMDDGVISNYVKSKSIGDEYRGAIESVQNRITNFDPEATRADGSIVGPEGFGEFIFANTRFGKLDSKKALAIKAEKQKQEVRGDQVTETGKTVFEGLVSEEPSKKKKAEPKGQKRREIQSLSNVYGVANEIGLNNKIQALIEQNPKNLEAAIKDLIQKDIRKTTAKQMGKISKIQGEVVVSDEYKAFLGFNYENIVKGLDVATIKKNYNQLFELTEIGKEDRRTLKSDKPSLKKDSNYRKGIFKIETNKAKFTKFFTEGGYTTLLDRQKKLAILISESIVEDVVNGQIIENSNNIDTVIQAEVRNYLNKLNRQKKEVRGNYADQIKFSKTVNAKHFNELVAEGINGEIGSDVWISLTKIANPIIVKEAESVIELHNADYTKETSGFKDRVRKLVFPKRIKEKYFARPTNKNHPDSINELLDFTESLAEVMDPALVSTGLFEDMFGFTYRYGDKNRIGKDVHGRVMDSASKRKSDKNFIDKYGFDPSAAKKYMYNSTFGIMNRINTITNKSFNTVKEKLQAILDKEGANIEQANKQNYKVLEYVVTKAIQVVNKNPDKLVGALRWLESATSTIKGLRGLTRLTHLDVMAESQEPSTKHPDYKETYKVALESVKKKNKTKKLNLTDSQIKEAAKESALAQLKPKGEHLKPSANLMASFAELIMKYSKLDMSNQKTLVEFKKDFNKLIDGYDQALGNKSTYAIVDKTMGSQAEGDARLLTGLPNVRAKRFYHVSGVQSVGYISRTITQSKEFAKISDKADKAAKLNKAAKFSRSANNPTKGITVLDFDDTLATTKSGVRAKIPNTDGSPKPSRKVIFLAGGAGSGKGNVISKLNLEKQGFKIVNSDISLEWLKKNSGLPANMNDFTKEQRSKLGSLQHQARGIAKRKMTKYKGNADGVVVDGTGGSIKSMEKLVNEFKDKGYDVSMLFVETSLPVALERNAARKERSLLDKIVTRNHESVQGNKDGFKKMFGDRFMEVNTDNLSQEDAMPIELTEKMNDFVSGYENRRLDAEEFASEGADILDQGGTFDFSEFNKVVEGQTAPLFEKAMKLQKKFGNKDMFVLTARPADSAPAIFEFLKANGLNIPLKNITGLANSTSEAKALWIADKVGEGFNDFYFADDALQNVQAVKNMLDQFDVKSKVQQAKVKFSKSINENFNDILENVTGIESDKRFSIIKGRKRGDSKGKFRLFIPPSHEDFVGLLYNFMGKGKEGNKHRDFFEQALVRPLNRAYREIDTAKQAIANDYKSLNEQFSNVKDKLIKTTPDGDFTFQDAIRVYLWNKHGYKIPGLTPTDQQNLVDLVVGDPELQAYAETLNVISKQEKYVDPGQNWETGNIRIDLVDATGRVGRKEYFSEFNENAEVMFSEENLNKIEAAYGKDFREALEDMLYRIGTGVNRPKGSSAKPNIFMNWLNASVSGVMFFNTRSALLQQMSNVNFLNFADNNIYAAGKAFANQKQYWKDFAMIFNSDMLKQRRGGIGTDINGAELAEAIKKARPDNIFDQIAIITGKALKLGFLPTQIGDNIAIATGGAAFYRNRVNKNIKDGMSIKEAEAAAFTDLQNITQSTQQSARPDMTSKQQASWIGKLVLNFLNTPSQYNRIIKKAGSDILNRRITPPNTTQMQSDMSNMSRVLYYGAAQNLIFYSLQTALFAVMFGTDDEDDDKRAEQFLKKKERVINGSIDTILRGSGIYGVAVSTLKNMIIKFAEQREKGYNKDESAVIMELANFSPVVGIKLRKIVNAEKTLNYNKKVIDEMETFDIDNPQWSAVTNYVESITTAPVNRLYQKTINLRNASDNQYTAFQRALFLSGYTTWSLNLGDTEKMKEIKEKTKSKKKEKTNTRSRTRTRTRSRTRTR